MDIWKYLVNAHVFTGTLLCLDDIYRYASLLSPYVRACVHYIYYDTIQYMTPIVFRDMRTCK